MIPGSCMNKYNAYWFQSFIHMTLLQPSYKKLYDLAQSSILIHLHVY